MLCKVLKTIIILGRTVNMTRNAGSCMKGIGVGLLIGGAAGIAGTMLASGNKRKLKKHMKNMSGTMTDMLDSIGGMFK